VPSDESFNSGDRRDEICRQISVRDFSDQGKHGDACFMNGREFVGTVPNALIAC
jgi:hypothetical protein